MTDKEIEEILERSKLDNEIIVGSDIRQVCRAALEARKALVLLFREVRASGNDSAEDFGWAEALAATRTVLADREKKG